MLSPLRAQARCARPRRTARGTDLIGTGQTGKVDRFHHQNGKNDSFA
ncbi:hypothetical protein RGE_09880 [Rubrivivax gelatinosus IL144]|uniref:Uncharacterized protein n=1 Tax=Rubrivivax gelatinosus (strain NBRC 100245 / IL144) TaxID=983917 RepID=I0HMU2_RUBGI|nr:hypothetical protein RGE_09880 [Rubrivivax gelatinosus IL144]